MNPTPAALSEGAIPPLSVLPARVTKAQLVQKVTSGTAVNMYATSSLYRGRMPVFNHLTENEAADVYEYLTQYPPTELASVDRTAVPTRARPINQRVDTQQTRTASAPPEFNRVRPPRVETELVALLVAAGLFVVALLALGCWMTVHEFKKISLASQAREASTGSPKMTTTQWFRLYPSFELVGHTARGRPEPMERKAPSRTEERRIS